MSHKLYSSNAERQAAYRDRKRNTVTATQTRVTVQERLKDFLTYLGGPSIEELRPETIADLEAEMNNQFHAGWEQALAALRAPKARVPRKVYTEQEYWTLYRKMDRYRVTAKAGLGMARSVMSGSKPSVWLAKMFLDFYEVAKKR